MKIYPNKEAAEAACRAYQEAIEKLSEETGVDLCLEDDHVGKFLVADYNDESGKMKTKTVRVYI
jgi:hypothetical protein